MATNMGIRPHPVRLSIRPVKNLPPATITRPPQMENDQSSLTFNDKLEKNLITINENIKRVYMVVMDVLIKMDNLERDMTSARDYLNTEKELLPVLISAKDNTSSSSSDTSSTVKPCSVQVPRLELDGKGNPICNIPGITINKALATDPAKRKSGPSSSKKRRATSPVMVMANEDVSAISRIIEETVEYIEENEYAPDAPENDPFQDVPTDNDVKLAGLAEPELVFIPEEASPVEESTPASEPTPPAPPPLVAVDQPTTTTFLGDIDDILGIIVPPLGIIEPTIELPSSEPAEAVQVPQPKKLPVRLPPANLPNPWSNFKVTDIANFQEKNRVLEGDPEKRKKLIEFFVQAKPSRIRKFNEWFTDEFLDAVMWKKTRPNQVEFCGTPISAALEAAWSDVTFNAGDFIRLQIYNAKTRMVKKRRELNPATAVSAPSPKRAASSPNVTAAPLSGATPSPKVTVASTRVFPPVGTPKTVLTVPAAAKQPTATPPTAADSRQKWLQILESRKKKKVA